MRMISTFASVCLAVFTFCWACDVAAQGRLAQAPPSGHKAKASPGAPKAKASAKAPKLSVPPAEQLVLLTRLSLLTLNDAILTGNYSVLRDRGAPAFRQANRPSDLARVFTRLEAQRPDLAAVATSMPRLTNAQIVGEEQRLRIKGLFPMQPLQIHFDLAFEPVNGQWQLFGLAVRTVRAETLPQARTEAPPETPTSKTKAKERNK